MTVDDTQPVYTGEGEERRIHTWDHNGCTVYIRDSPQVLAPVLPGKQERYELRLYDPNGSRYSLPVTQNHGSYESEDEAIAAAVDLFNVEDPR